MGTPDLSYRGRYTIVITARMFSLFPWPMRTFTMESPEGFSWSQAYEMAARMFDTGSPYRISLYQAEADR